MKILGTINDDRERNESVCEGRSTSTRVPGGYHTVEETVYFVLLSELHVLFNLLRDVEPAKHAAAGGSRRLLMLHHHIPCIPRIRLPLQRRQVKNRLDAKEDCQDIELNEVACLHNAKEKVEIMHLACFPCLSRAWDIIALSSSQYRHTPVLLNSVLQQGIMLCRLQYLQVHTWTASGDLPAPEPPEPSTMRRDIASNCGLK